MTDVQMREGLVLGTLVTVQTEQLESLIAQRDKWQQRAEAAEKALAEARKDTERMDWLEKQRAGVFPGMPKEKHNYWFVRRYDNRQEPQPMALLRAAIDAAKEGK